MSVITRLIGLSIFVLMVFACLMLGGHLGNYIDIPSLVFVTGVLVGGMMMCFGVDKIADAFVGALTGEFAMPVPARVRLARIAVFARAYQLSWGAGLVGSVIGLIAMLSDLSSPHAIGAGLAVALLTTFYGAMLAEFIFAPLQQTVMNQTPEGIDPSAAGDVDAHSPITSPGSSGLWRGVAVIAIMASAILALMVSFPESSMSQDDFEGVVEDIRDAYGMEPVEDGSLASAEDAGELIQ